MALYFLFIKPLATCLTWILILSSNKTFAGLLPRPPLEELLPLPLELFLPLPLPRLMDDYAVNAPSNDVFVMLILCS